MKYVELQTDKHCGWHSVEIKIPSTTVLYTIQYWLYDYPSEGCYTIKSSIKINPHTFQQEINFHWPLRFLFEHSYDANWFSLKWL